MTEEEEESALVPAYVKEIMKGAPGLLAMAFPKLAVKLESHQAIAAHLINSAADNPELLTDADISIVDDFLHEAAANWVKRRYVDKQAEIIRETLERSPLFALMPATGKSDSSFDETLNDCLRGASLEDQKMLDLYAAIKAGESCRPGIFSKLTCRTVSNLNQEAIASFERITEHVIFAAPHSPLGVLSSLPRLAYTDIMTAADFGLISGTVVSFGPGGSEGCATFMCGSQAVRYIGKFKVRIHPLTKQGRELIQIHQQKQQEASPLIFDELEQDMQRSFMVRRRIISPRYSRERGTVKLIGGTVEFSPASEGSSYSGPSVETR